MPKPKSKTASSKNKATPDAAARLADTLSDKPYGSAPDESGKAEKQTRLTVSMPDPLFCEIEDLSRLRKRNGDSDWSMSAMVREAMRAYLDQQKL